MNLTRDQRIERRVRALELSSVLVRQGVVTSIDPIQVSIAGSENPAPALALDGIDYSVNDRVSVFCWASDLIVSKPVENPAGSGDYIPDFGDGSGEVAEGNDARFPTVDEKAALAGTNGSPGSGNRYVTDSDSRNSDQRTPSNGSVTASKVAASLKPSGSAVATDEALRRLGTGSSHAAAGDDARFPTTGQKNALAGANGTPGTGNEFLTVQSKGAAGSVGKVLNADDPTTTDARTPTSHAASHKSGGLDELKLSDFAVPSADIPLNTKKFTGVAQGTAAGHFAEYAQMIAGDVAAQLGLTSKLSVYAAPITALPANTRTGDTLNANANGLLSVAFGDLQFSWKSGSTGSGNGQFNRPYDVALDSSGNVFVADYGNSRVQKFNSSGVYQSQFSVAIGTNALAIDGSGNVWVVGSVHHSLAKYNSSGTLVGTYSLNGSSLLTGYGVAVDSSGNVYVAAAAYYGGINAASEIQKFNSSGVYQATYGSAGSGNGQFNVPNGVAVDSSGNIWVADTGNNRVQKLNSSGTYQSQFGSAGTGDGQLNAPTGIAFDPNGNIWVADGFNSRLQRFSSAGSYQTQISSSGSGNGQLLGPRGIELDSSGNLFVADQNNNRFQKFIPFAFPATPFDVLVNRESGLGVPDVKNGIYTVSSVGSVSTKWAMTRRADAAGTYLKNNAFVIAQKEAGTVNRAFIVTTPDPITANTTAIAWDRFEPGGPPSPHAVNHLPGSADPLPTAAASTLSGTNSEGTATTFARADHNHELPAWGTSFATPSMTDVATSSVTADRVYFCRVHILTKATITGIQYYVGASAGNVRAALYNSTGTRVANRSSNLAVGTGLNPQQVPFDSTYSADPGVYYMALVFSSASASCYQHIAALPSSFVAGPGSGATATSITPPTTIPTTRVPTMSTY